MAESPVRVARRATSRLRPLLDAAAREFADRGFYGTTTRDITSRVTMTPGSIYSHFASKDELLLAVYTEGVQRLLARLDAAEAAAQTPWEQLEGAVIAHLEAILDQSDYARVMVQVRPQDVPSVSSRLHELREQVEARYRTLVGRLNLPVGVDRKFFRLLLLGAMNWSPVWFRPEKDHARRIGRCFLNIVKAGSYKDERE
jgi:AcrR family transcriptional regulator